MGKNTLMKRCIRLYCERTGSDTWAALLEALVGNVGIVFTKGDLGEVSDWRRLLDADRLHKCRKMCSASWMQRFNKRGPMNTLQGLLD